MMKFGMSEYEVNQNIFGVAIANFVALGMLIGVGTTIVVAGVVYGIAKVVF